MRPCRIGTSSGTRVASWPTRRLNGSDVRELALQSPWLSLGERLRAAFP